MNQELSNSSRGKSHTNSIASIFIFTFIATLAACQSNFPDEVFHEAAKLEKHPEFKLGPGDSIRIRVYDQENLSGLYTVDDIGRISLPLIHGVNTIGLTLPELEQRIAGELSDKFEKNYPAPELEKHSEFKLGPGDTIRVRVYEHDVFSGDYNVDDTGRVSLPLILGVNSKGLTLPELEQRIATELSDNFIVNPKVSIQLIKPRPFCIVGEVRNPGCFSSIHGIDSEKAIALAGGYTYRAYQERIIVTREDGSKIVANASTPIYAGDTMEVIINPVVSIELIKSRPFCILGEVRRPGCFSGIHGMNTAQAIAIAGGYTYRAYKEKFAVTREDGRKVVADTSTPIFGGDTIEVYERYF